MDDYGRHMESENARAEQEAAEAEEQERTAGAGEKCAECGDPMDHYTHKVMGLTAHAFVPPERECAGCGHPEARHLPGHGCTVEDCGHDDHLNPDVPVCPINCTPPEREAADRTCCYHGVVDCQHEACKPPAQGPQPSADPASKLQTAEAELKALRLELISDSSSDHYNELVEAVAELKQLQHHPLCPKCKALLRAAGLQEEKKP
jgi:hypothetical protein